jgi:ATP-dependent DNA helicase RecG
LPRTLFPDKLLTTPNLENALSGVSYYRNPIIAYWLHDYRLSEKLGRGLFKMMKSYKANQLPAPQLIVDPSCFKVILPNANQKTSSSEVSKNLC